MIGREYMKKRILEGKKLEWVGLILFAIAYAVISAFHEPWFDEAQAWQIAKCASLREMLLEIPHYEGHPPLWHLILAIPAKLGVPFEIGLKTVGFLISTTSAALMLFRSRLPRLLRLTLPFTYFFFYQYGIIVRPYGLMLLILLLLGMELGERNEHPWRIALLLGTLCLTGAYGMVFAGGIAICFLWELWREKGLRRFWKELFRDGRTISLLALLIWAILLIWEMLPAEDAFAVHIQSKASFPLRAFCALFTFPVECFLSTSSWFSMEQVSLQAIEASPAQLILCAVLGLILWFGLVCASSKKEVKFLVIPYALLAAFAATVYFSTHHIGVVFTLVLFWAELTSREKEQMEIGKTVSSRIAKGQRDKALFRQAGIVLLVACMVIPLYWSVSASIHEIQKNYAFARSMAAFLQEQGLDSGTRIFAPYSYGGSIFPEAEGNEDYICTDIIGGAVPLNAYFDRNIVFNLNNGNDEEAYVHYKIANYEESRAKVADWREMGPPDVVIGFPALESVYGDSVSSADYTCVYKRNISFLWKNTANNGYSVIYVRNDLLDRYDLEAVDDWDLRYWNEGITITDEMREEFSNGVPMEEILKPYLDAMFGEAD